MQGRRAGQGDDVHKKKPFLVDNHPPPEVEPPPLCVEPPSPIWREVPPFSVPFLSFSCSVRQKSCQIKGFRPISGLNRSAPGKFWILY